MSLSGPQRTGEKTFWPAALQESHSQRQPASPDWVRLGDKTGWGGCLRVAAARRH
jgi:hypothetical protein